MRIEARKSHQQLRSDFELLKDLHSKALDARKALNGARGLLNSSATENYEKKWKANSQELRVIEGEINKFVEPDSQTREAKLEEILMAIHKTSVRINRLRDDYQRDADDNEREKFQLSRR